MNNIVGGSAARRAREVNRGVPNGSDIHGLCRVGRLTFVDYERFTCEVEMLDGLSTYREVELAVGSFGPRHFVGAMPEIGEVVVVGFFRDAAGRPRPRVIAALGGGVKQSLNWDIVQQRQRSGGAESRRPRRQKLVKLYPGDALVQAAGGATAHFTETLALRDGAGQEMLLRAFDRHALLRVLNWTRATGAGRWYSGPVIRNPLAPSSAASHAGIPAVVFPDGRRVFYVTPGRPAGPLPPVKESGPYTEDRGVIRQFSDLVLDVFGELDQTEVDQWRNLVAARNGRFMEWCRGTFVGDDSDADEAALYGVVVRLQMFADSFAAEELTDHRYVAAEDAGREGALAIADHWRFFGSAQIVGGSATPFIRDVDKYGTLYEIVPASGVSQPLGAGISIVRATRGAIKEHIGKSQSHGNDPPKRLDAISGESEEVIEAGVSVFRTLDGSFRMKIKGPDTTGDAWVIEVAKGNARLLINGDMEMHVTGQVQEWIDGGVQRVVKGDLVERVEGSYRREIVGDEYRHTGGQRQVLVNGDDVLHVGGGRAVATVRGQNQTLAPHPLSPVASPPQVPQRPTQDGLAGKSPVPQAAPTPGAGQGIPAPPSDTTSREYYGGQAERGYALALNEQMAGPVRRDYNGPTVDEAFVGAVSRRYATTLSEEVVLTYSHRSGVLQMDVLGVAKITAAGPMVLTSTVSLAEAAPVVIRG